MQQTLVVYLMVSYIERGKEMRKFQKLSLWLLAMILVVLAGCGGQTSTSDVSTPRKPGAMNYPLKIKDQMGNEVTIKKQPQRIVTLVPSATEITYALGLDKQMVGNTTNDDYPEAAKKLPKVGDMNVNPEKVLSLKPDVVFADEMNGKETIDKLKKLGLTVIVLNAESIKEVYQSIDIVGKVTNRARESDQLVAKMQSDLLPLYRKLGSLPEQKRLKVWVEISPDLYTAGKGTFMDELVRFAGGKNVAGNLNGWVKVSPEEVVKWNPDVIICTHGDTKAILARKGWQNMKAVKEKRVIAVDANLTSRPGPRIIQGYKEIAKAIYPDQVGE
jgi:iron complex transport system substrate-binding protein